MPNVRGRGTGSNPANRFEKRSFEADPEAADPEAPLPRTQFLKDSSRSILAQNDSPDIGFERSINPYRGCEHGCVYCLSGDTPILLADGTHRPLADLRPGDWVYGTRRSGGHRRYVKTPVTAHWPTRKAAFRVILEDGTQVVASGDHRFLTERGWKYVTGTVGGRSRRPHLTRNTRLMGVGQHLIQPTITRYRNLDQAAVETSDQLRVVSIEPIDGKQDLFDISTGTGDFIANGIVSHNCYARPYHEFLGFSSGLDFETKILVKEDAPELLREELSSPKWTPQTIAISGVTDAYQPAERSYRLTRRCLEVLADFRNPALVITKNHLVTRDIDVLSELARHRAAAVVLSITTLDPGLARLMEPRTSTPSRRLAAIEALARAGIPAGVNVAPIIPGLTDSEVPAILAAAARAGASFAGHTLLRLPYAVKDLFSQWLADHFPARREKVLHRIRGVRGGGLNDPRFGSRMSGEGVYAEQISALFELSRKKAGIARGRAELSAAAFRRPPGPQLTLF